MATIATLVGNPRTVLWAILATSLGALSLALIAEHVFGLQPCTLCLYQRIPHATIGLAAGLGLVFVDDTDAQRRVVALCGIIFAAGAGLAFYHVGVERGWWASFTACGGAPPTTLTIDELRNLLTRPVAIPCDQPSWTLFGVSLAGYNFVASLGLAVFALVAARPSRPGVRP